MTETGSLHVIVCHFDYQFRSQRFPRQILSLAPSALASRHPAENVAGPLSPRMTVQCVFTIRRKEFHQLAPLGIREARADADMLQCARIVEQSEQQRPDGIAIPSMPSKPRDDAVTLAIVLHF